MKIVLRAILALSLALNILFVYENWFGRPDVTISRTSLEHAYFVRGYQQGLFTIEHDGHRYTAKCRASLTWLEGTENPAKPMTDAGREEHRR
jgi:hypothetical protein